MQLDLRWVKFMSMWLLDDHICRSWKACNISENRMSNGFCKSSMNKQEFNMLNGWLEFKTILFEEWWASEKKLTPFIWNIFLYCFPRAFFGSVRTYKKIIAFKSHRGNWLVLNKRLEKDYNDGIFINTFKRTNHMRQIISHQIHPIKTNGKVYKNSGQMCWILFMSFLLESAQLSLFNISSWSIHIWSSFSYSRKHNSIKISAVT